MQVSPRRAVRVSRRAFTLIETAACVAGSSVALAVAGPLFSHTRVKDAHFNCSARMAGLGSGNAQFALSHNDLMAGFTWQTGGANSQYPDLNALQAQANPMNAQSAQALDIMRRRGRPDIAPAGWLANIAYSTLVLNDFQNRPLADVFNICPSHDNLNKWRRWPAQFDQGRFMPAQPAPSGINKRWPYRSSYLLTAAAFDLNQTVFTHAGTSSRLSNGGDHGAYLIPSTAKFGPSSMSSVFFPSRKSHMADSHQRHLPGLHLFSAYPTSVQPHLFFDGSVSTRVSQNARVPWHSTSPQAPWGQQFNYSPRLWEPATQSGQPFQWVEDRFYYTRDGLQGWDFD